MTDGACVKEVCDPERVTRVEEGSSFLSCLLSLFLLGLLDMTLTDLTSLEFSGEGSFLLLKPWPYAPEADHY